MTEDRTIDDDKAVLAAEFGYMTTVIEEALDRLGRPEEGILGELGMLISALAELADDARCKVAPPIVDALTAAVVAGSDFRDAARVAVCAGSHPRTSPVS